MHTNESILFQKLNIHPDSPWLVTSRLGSMIYRTNTVNNNSVIEWNSDISEVNLDFLEICIVNSPAVFELMENNKEGKKAIGKGEWNS